MNVHRLLGLASAALLSLVMSGCTSGYQNGWHAHERGEHDVAYQEWKPLAEQGNPRAQYLLGVLHEDGMGARQDHALAAQWYQRAADQGFAPAQNNLGLMYYKGQGVPRDRELAAAWYERAASQGNAHAQNNLAVMHLLGQIKSSDPDEAARLLRLASASGNPKAQQILLTWSADQEPQSNPAPATATVAASTPNTQPQR